MEYFICTMLDVLVCYHVV